MRRSPARLVIALSVAAVLAVFLVYVAIAGGGTPDIQPSELKNRKGEVVLTGRVVDGSIRETAEGVRFRLRDIEGTASVLVVYPDEPPDQFKDNRDLSLRGRLTRAGLFRGEAGTMITKCPSKYESKKRSQAS